MTCLAIYLGQPQRYEAVDIPVTLRWCNIQQACIIFSVLLCVAKVISAISIITCNWTYLLSRWSVCAAEGSRLCSRSHSNGFFRFHSRLFLISVSCFLTFSNVSMRYDCADISREKRKKRKTSRTRSLFNSALFILPVGLYGKTSNPVDLESPHHDLHLNRTTSGHMTDRHVQNLYAGCGVGG